MDGLIDYRKKIDEADKELLNLFLKRMEYSKEIAKIKEERNLPIFDKKREEEVIKSRVENIDNDNLKGITKELFQKIMDLSKLYQYDENNKNSKIESSEKIGYLGEKGSYSHQAAKGCFESGNLISFDTFEEIFESIEKDKLKFGVLPIENTSTGSIISIYDLLKKYNFNIVGEKNIEINHCLLARKKVKLEDVKIVYSHPQAIDQSKEFLKEYNWEIINQKNTSGSALMVSKSDRRDIAAIASIEAAKIYNLDILKSNINYNEKNITRFIIISKEICVDKKADKITLGFSVDHKPGQLYNVLGIFDKNNINMHKLESRPIIGSPFEYYFYIDLQGNLKEFKVKNIIEEIKKSSNSFKIYGNYIEDSRWF
jgi:chorismate mutase/prephenate dehydratase